MRRIQIKIWPELVGYLPAIIPFDRIEENKLNPIDIDFSNVENVESSSLTLILIKLIKIGHYIKNRDWDIKFSNYDQVNKKIIDSLFIDIINRNIPNNKLFLQNEYLRRNIKFDEIPPYHVSSYPIYEINFLNDLDRRIAVEVFKDYLVEKFQFLYSKYKFKTNKFIQIIHEIAKNSADHTEHNAFFGIDISQQQNELTIKFVFGDLGEGINQNVRKVLQNDSNYIDKYKHLAVTDSYNYALSMGFTSKPYSMMNRGIGMSTIFDLSKQINLKLSVFDAKSRGVISNAKNISHVELRRVFYNIGFSVGFYYYGELKHSIL